MNYSLIGVIIDISQILPKTSIFKIFHTKTMILRGYFYVTCLQVLNGLIGATMTELKLIRRAAVGKAQDLMSKTDTENRFFAEKLPDRLHNSCNPCRISRTICQENAVRL